MSSEIDTVEGEVIEPEGEPLPPEIRKKRGLRRLEQISVDSVERFLNRLAETGLYSDSADYSGLHVVTIGRLRKNDSTFQELCDEAMEVYRETLVRECHRRAVAGWDEPVFSQKLGTRIGVIRKYDSRLLELMLKRHIPEYREKFEGEIKVTGGVLIAPAAASSIEDWSARHGGAVLSQYGDAPQLPPADAAPPPSTP